MARVLDPTLPRPTMPTLTSCISSHDISGICCSRVSSLRVSRPGGLSYSADEECGPAGLFIGWRPIGGRSGCGRGLRERSQFAGSGHGTGEVEAVVHAAFGGGFGLSAGAAEFGIGAVPGAFEGSDLALNADKEFGGRGLGEEGGG